MTVVRVEEVLADLMQRKPECRIRIVGIDGPSGSGKSTVAARLALLGGAPIFEIDDFVSWSDFAGW
jgi:uridine kinase